MGLTNIFFAAMLFAPDCQTPSANNCTFYASCLEKTIPCGTSGYALSYGEKYCNAFKDAEFDSPDLLQWRDSTMLCLQQKLAGLLETRRDLRCQDISDFAFTSHVECYTAPDHSICDLSAHEKREIRRIIERRDLLTPEARKQIREVLRICRMRQ